MHISSRWVIAIVMLCHSAVSCKAPVQPTPAEQAIASLQESIGRYPDSLKLRLQLSDLLEEKGYPDEADSVIMASMPADSSIAILWNRHASLLLGKGDTAGGIASLERSLRLASRQFDVMLEMGFIQAARGDKNALEIASQVQAAAPDARSRVAAEYLKGLYHANTGNEAAALEHFERCIISDYGYIDAHLEKGIILFGQGKPGDALQVFEMAMSVDNANADLYYWSGRCLASLGRVTEAVEQYRKALGLDERLKAAKTELERLGY